MAACPIFCLAIKRKRLCVHVATYIYIMYVTLTDLQNGEPVYITRSLSGELEVALCELSYYHQCCNISAALKNNQVSTYKPGEFLPNTPHETMTAPDGYYNVCELNEELLQPIGAELNLHAPTGRLQLSTKTRIEVDSRLAKLLVFSTNTFEPGKIFTASEPHGLAIYRNICVHLDEVSSSDNLHNGHPSTLLRSLLVGNERSGSGRTETFPVLQYKRLSSGPVLQLTISLRDTNGRRPDFEYLSATLHIRIG